jgi:hypothetical protein
MIMEELKKLALAAYLNRDPEDIEDGYRDGEFEVSPRQEKDGKPPAYWQERADLLSEKLLAADPSKTTWEEWAAVSDEDFRQECLMRLSLHPTIDNERPWHNDNLMRGIEATTGRWEIPYYRAKRLLGDELDTGTANDLFHLIAGDTHDYGRPSWHVYAIRAGFNGGPIEDQRTTSHCNSGEYAVLFDYEADERAAEYIEESLWAFNADFLASMTDFPESIFTALQPQCENANEAILAIVEKTCGMEAFVDAAVSADGRAHFLNTYDDEEDEFSFEVPEEMQDEYGSPVSFLIYRLG